LRGELSFYEARRRLRSIKELKELGEAAGSGILQEVSRGSCRYKRELEGAVGR
jgi:hypothetical protein